MAALGGGEGAGELVVTRIDQQGHGPALVGVARPYQPGDSLDLAGVTGHRAGDVDQLGIVGNIGIEQLLYGAAKLVRTDAATDDDRHRAMQVRYLDIDRHRHTPQLAEAQSSINRGA